MDKTNTGLVDFAEKALKEGWYYLWGAYGQIATQTVLDNNIKQYPSNEIWRSYAAGAIGKTRFCDCYGLIKAYLWWIDDSSSPKYSSAQDLNTSAAYNASKEKGPLSTLPEIPGIILYMPGHVGVYCGNNKTIELMGNGVGAYQGQIENGAVKKGSKFTHWFKDIHLDYTEGGLTMTEYSELKELIQNLTTKVNSLNNEKIYKNINEVPDWGKPAINFIIEKGGLADSENLDLSYDMLRLLAINYRMGCYQ